MPVLEFALDTSALYRIQIHVNTRQGPVSVMLNQNVLGSLATLQEQTTGKDFRLPDNSTLRVRVLNGHPQAWRDGHPLLLTSVSGSLPELSQEEKRKSMGTGTLAFLILNALILGVLSVSFFVSAFTTLNLSLLFVLLSLMFLAALGSLFALLTWRKWGLYLTGFLLIVSFILALLSGVLDFRFFAALAVFLLFSAYLRTNAIWRQMR